MNLDKNYKGIDADLETSLEEYGFVARPITIDYPDEYFVIYKMGENEYGSGHIRVSELDALVNGTEWASDDDINSMLETVGSSKEEWMSLPFESKFNDLISYWGTENVMGTDYYPNDKKWAFEEIGIDESEEDDTFEINSISELYDWEESSQYPYARDMVAYFIFGDRDDNLIDKAIRGVYSKERADESKLSEIMLGYENNWKENMEQLDVDTVEELGDLMDYYAKGGNTAKTYDGINALRSYQKSEIEDIQEYIADNGTIIEFVAMNDRDSSSGMTFAVTINGRGIYASSSREKAMEFYKDEIAKYKNNYKYAKGGSVKDNLEKELRKLQRELNSSRLGTYREGDDSEEAMALRRERESKLTRFNDVLKTLNEIDKDSFANGGGVETRTISYEDGGLAGLVDEEQMRDISFKIKVKTMPKEESIILHEVIEIEEYDAVGEKNVNLPKFHLIYGNNSLAIFDAFGVDEVAGLKREDAVEFIENLKKQGKTEKDGSFMAGLTNFSGDQIFMFFNVERLNFKGFANRVLPHEALHLSRYLISLYKNKWMRENLNTPNWWEDKRATFTELNDDNEEFFAETLERTTAIAMDGWFRATGSRCLADGGNIGLFEDGGETEESRLVGSFYYDTRKDKTFRIIYSDKNKIQIQYFNRNKEEDGKLIDVPKDEFNYLLQMGAWNKYKQSFFKDGGETGGNDDDYFTMKDGSRMKKVEWYEKMEENLGFEKFAERELKDAQFNQLANRPSNELTHNRLNKKAVIGKKSVTISSYTPNYDRFLDSKTFENIKELNDYLNKNNILDNGGGVDGFKRFDVDFYDDISTNIKTSVELIIRADSLNNAIEDAIKKAHELKKNYIEFYHRGFFLGSINFANSNDFIKGKFYNKFISDDLYADGGGIDGDYYANSGSVKSKAKKLFEERISYRWKNTDMGSGWLIKLDSPNDDETLEEELYLDIYDFDEDEYSFEDWKEDMLQTSKESFIDKYKEKYFDDFLEYIQRDKDDYYADGGDIESSQDFFLSEKELKNYNHEKIGNIDFYYKKSNKNRYSGVTKEVYFKDSTRPSFSITFESEPKKVYDKLKERTKIHKYKFNDIIAVKYADGGDIKNEFYIFEGIDHYSSTPLFRVESTSDSDAEYIGEWHTDRNDAEMELRELNGDSFNEDIYSNVDEELIRVSAEEIYNEQGFMNFRNLFLKLADTDERSGDIETANFRRALVKEYQEKQPRIK